jgi:hypothetical protein
MPKGLNYCKTCDKFTRRKRGHKGRCKPFAPVLLDCLLIMMSRLSWKAKTSATGRELLDACFGKWCFRTQGVEEVV